MLFRSLSFTQVGVDTLLKVGNRLRVSLQPRKNRLGRSALSPASLLRNKRYLCLQRCARRPLRQPQVLAGGVRKPHAPLGPVILHQHVPEGDAAQQRACSSQPKALHSELVLNLPGNLLEAGVEAWAALGSSKP